MRQTGFGFVTGICKNDRCLKKKCLCRKQEDGENNIYYKMAKSYSMLGKILYAEDDFLTREIVGEKLEEEGYAVVLAKDGKEAWNEFQQNVFDAELFWM